MPSGDTATDATLESSVGSSGDLAPGDAGDSMMSEVVVGGARIQGDTSTLPGVVVEEDGRDN